MKLCLMPGMLVCLAGLAGCAAPRDNDPSFLITRGSFVPARVTVQPGRHFLISIDLIDNGTTTISSPDLGIKPHHLASNYAKVRLRGAPAIDMSKRLHFRLGPLDSGSYAILCSCFGHPATAQLIVAEAPS